MRKIYLDYAASTPVAPEVEQAMRPYFSRVFGNPGSVHSFGQDAIRTLDSAREVVARAIAAQFREVVFTGSATEANNLALRGTVRKFWWNFFKGNERKKKDSDILPHIITTTIEHESVLETLRDIERRGAARVTILPVNRNGVLDPTNIQKALDENTILVSVMYANNEIGSVQPVSEISRVIRNFREKIENRPARMTEGIRSGGNEKIESKKSSSLISHFSYPLFHTDAAQALQFLDCNVDELGVDLMTISAHKIYGPKGVGGLYVRQKIENRPARMTEGIRSGGNEKIESKKSSSLISHLSPLITGGGQEFGLRSGTENIPNIVGFARAIEDTVKKRASESQRLRILTADIWKEIKKVFPKATINGPDPDDQRRRLPHILNVHFPGIAASYLTTWFDLQGIAVSAGSACNARAERPSYVVEALGFGRARAKESIRFSLGRPTTKQEIDSALACIRKLARQK